MKQLIKIIALLLFLWPLKAITYTQEDIRLEASNEMRLYMNENIDPCENFFEFACGNWHNIHPADDDHHKRTTSLDILKDTLDHNIRDILNSGEHPDDTISDRDVKNFYKSCIELRENFDAYKKKLKEIPNEFGGMPALSGDEWNSDHFDWLETAAKIFRKYDISTILEISIDPDIYNNTINRLYIGGNPLNFNTRSAYFDNATESDRQQMKEHIRESLNKLFDMNDTLAEQTAEEIVNFEISLAECKESNSDILPLDAISIATNIEEMQQKYAPIIDVKRFINITFGELINEPVYEIYENCQRNLQKVIQQTPQYIVANYIMYKLLKNFFIYPKETEAQQEDYCIEYVAGAFETEMNIMAYRKYQNNQSEDFIHFLFNELKETLKNRLVSNQYDWLEKSTQQSAIDKLNRMNFFLNVELEYLLEDFGDFPTMDNESYIENILAQYEYSGRHKLDTLRKTPHTASDPSSLAFTPNYDTLANQIVLPVSHLQPYYLWAAKYPYATKFGSIGASMAHEIIHGFDDDGRKYDKYGNINNWWDESAIKAFEERTKCFIEQYSNYEYNGKKLPKHSYQGENIADNGGLKIAYEAYLRWYNRTKDGHLEYLPNLNYNHKQLFFVGFAQFSCIDMVTSSKEMTVATDVHTPLELRSIGALSNLKEFAQEFNCPLGTPMNPSEKCQIY